MKQVRVLMVGLPDCTVCKEMLPKVSEYCNKCGVPFEYKMFKDLEEKYRSMIISKKVTHAPILLALSPDDSLLGIHQGGNSLEGLKDLIIDCMQVTIDDLM